MTFLKLLIGKLFFLTITNQHILRKKYKKSFAFSRRRQIYQKLLKLIRNKNSLITVYLKNIIQD